MLLLTLEAATEAAVNTVGRPPSLLLDRYKKERERERERERRGRVEKVEGEAGKRKKKKGNTHTKDEKHLACLSCCWFIF